jgi:flagellar operon protein
MIDQIFYPNPVKPGGQSVTQPRNQTSGQVQDSPFARVLDEKLPTQGVKFSQHAQERLKSRNIVLSDKDLSNLEGAVNNVAQKGGKESLVMMKDAALVVSIKNRTVVTAMDRNQMQGNVFTNIDSAVII